MTVFDYKQVPVMEKFVGKNHPELKKVEEELRQLIKLVKSKTKDNLTKTNNVLYVTKMTNEELTRNKHNKEIEKQLKKLFKLREIVISWSTSATINANTPINSFQVLNPHYKTNEKGIHNNEKLFIGINLYAGLITMADMNEKEILAIILHEIGHNFYNSIFQVLSSIPLSPAMVLMTGPTVLATIGFSLIAGGLRDVLKMPEAYMQIKGLFNKLLDMVPPIQYTMNLFGAFLQQLNSVMMLNPGVLVAYLTQQFKKQLLQSNTFLYNVEKHADSFAVDYGYGLYLSKALTKLNNPNNLLSTQGQDAIPFLNLFKLQWEIINPLVSGYPSNQNRIRTAMDRLKRSAKDPDLDPRMRKELQDQIEAYEKWYYGQYLNIESDINKKRVFTWAYNNMVETIFKGKLDVRELLHAIDPKKYE
jgi:hypothetical protein